MFWALWGAGLSSKPAGKREGAVAAGALASALAILVTTTALWQGARLNEEASQLAEQGRTAEAEATAASAAKWDPLLSEALARTADHALLLRAVQVDPTNPEAWFKLAVSHELRREWQLGREAAGKASALDPWKAAYVDKEARLAGYIMLDELATGNQAGAKAIATDLIAVEKGWTERLATAAPNQHLWNAGKESLNPGTKLRFGQARFLTGDLAGAQPALLEAAKVGLLNSEAEVWLYALYEKQGDAEKMKGLEQQPWVRVRDANPVYKAIRQ